MPNAQIRGRHPSGAQDPADWEALRAIAAPFTRDTDWSVRYLPDDGPVPSDWVLTMTPRAATEEAAARLAQAARALSLARPTWLWVLDPGVGDPNAPTLAMRGGAVVDEAMPAEVLPDGFFSIEMDYSHLDDPGDPPPPRRDDSEPILLAEGESSAPPDPHDVSLREWKMAVFPPDSDGDHPVVGSAVLSNASQHRASRIGVRFVLVDAAGGPLVTLDVDEEGSFEPGQSVVLARKRWLKAALPTGASFVVWGYREESTDLRVGALKPALSEPDRDGDVRASVFVEVENPGPAWDHAEILLTALDADGDPTGDTRSEAVGAVPSGRAPKEARWWIRASEADQLGRAFDVRLRLARTRWTRLSGDVALPIAALATTTPPATPPTPTGRPLAATPEPAAPPPAGDDVDAELASGDPVRIAAACDVARERGLKAFAPRLRALLADASPQVRAAAVAALGAVGGPSLIVAIRKLESDVDPGVRAAAAAAIAALTSR